MGGSYLEEPEKGRRKLNLSFGTERARVYFLISIIFFKSELPPRTLVIYSDYPLCLGISNIKYQESIFWDRHLEGVFFPSFVCAVKFSPEPLLNLETLYPFNHFSHHYESGTTDKRTQKLQVLLKWKAGEVSLYNCKLGVCVCVY